MESTDRASGRPGQRVDAAQRHGGKSLLRSIGLRTRNQSDLIASLNDVASAVSSRLSISDVLDTIVERAKLVTDTDKAILVLTGDETDEIDLGTLVVRGARGEHPQELWEARLAGIGARAFSEGETVHDVDAETGIRMLASPVKVQEVPIGLICAINSKGRRFNSEQSDFLAILSAFAASAIQNARLAEQSRYVLLSGERDRIAHEMHDGIAQSLFSISLALEVCRKQVTRDPAAVARRLDDLSEQMLIARAELRRFIYDLRPMKLSELGLAGAIDYWIREVTFGKDIKGHLETEGDAIQLTASQEFCLYRVAKEAVSNVAQHAHAHEFGVRLAYGVESVRLVVVDDGRGFDVDEALAHAGGGLGLRSIQQRVAREGGRLIVASSPDSGTSIMVQLPAGGA